MTDTMALLPQRLRAAGITDVVSVEPATGGLAATAGVVRRAGGEPVFVKVFDEPPSDDAFSAEAEGLAALRTLGGVATPDVLLAGPDLLVLSVLRPRPTTERFWEQLARSLARLHTGTTHPRFGWRRDNWLGRRRQVNTWTDDGFEFFAQHRLLRWLPEPPRPGGARRRGPGGVGAARRPAARAAARAPRVPHAR
ncbi:fructosamine kinase family protein [Puerhibacterium sp. TATVAM-FAB25]|uniref:fructosamine kinase family protein n=1 Tax=Puerhibacterium sp. TATVAM-FAB25 TaxID=3093699 RepID=UPI00397A63E8